jgi:hypothetical protein
MSFLPAIAPDTNLLVGHDGYYASQDIAKADNRGNCVICAKRHVGTRPMASHPARMRMQTPFPPMGPMRAHFFRQEFAFSL